MFALSLKLLLAYLLGSVVGSLLLGRLRGVDIRHLGSGNAGATNALRSQGRGFALAVALIEVCPEENEEAHLLIASILRDYRALHGC